MQTSLLHLFSAIQSSIASLFSRLLEFSPGSIEYINVCFCLKKNNEKPEKPKNLKITLKTKKIGKMKKMHFLVFALKSIFQPVSIKRLNVFVRNEYQLGKLLGIGLEKCF